VSIPASQHYRAFLFDMDGTLLNSIAAAERVWSIWAQRHGLDVAAFLATIHGARAIDTITRQALPGVDPDCIPERPAGRSMGVGHVCPSGVGVASSSGCGNYSARCVGDSRRCRHRQARPRLLRFGGAAAGRAGSGMPGVRGCDSGHSGGRGCRCGCDGRDLDAPPAHGDEASFDKRIRKITGPA